MANPYTAPKILPSVLGVLLLLISYALCTATLWASPQSADQAVACLNPSAVEIALESVVQGQIQASGEGCAFQFSGDQDQRVTLALGTAGETLDPVLQLFDPDGNSIAHNDDASATERNSRIQTLRLPQTGLYTVLASGFAGSTGDFTLSLTEGDFIPGDLVVSRSAVRLRQSPGTLDKPDGDIQTTIPPHKLLQIVGALTKADGLTWWPVLYGSQSGAGETDSGYVAQETANGLVLIAALDLTALAATPTPTETPTMTPNARSTQWAIDLTEQANQRNLAATANVVEWKQYERMRKIAEAQATLRNEHRGNDSRPPATARAVLIKLTTDEPRRETAEARASMTALAGTKSPTATSTPSATPAPPPTRTFDLSELRTITAQAPASPAPTKRFTATPATRPTSRYKTPVATATPTTKIPS